MRRMILTTLVLLPVTAFAHAATSTEPQPSSASANVSAALKTPAAAAATSLNTTHAVVREFVQTRMTEASVGDAMRGPGTIEYAFWGNVPTVTSEPTVTRAVEVGLTNEELAAQPAVMNVVIHATVDAYGFPRNLTVTKSAGELIDQKVLAAVGQYRFKPATLDNKPVDASVTISVKIAK